MATSVVDKLITRSDANPLIPTEVSREIIQDAVTSSAAMQLFRPVRMSTKQTKMHALSAFPVAYFVDGDTGLKQTTKAAWENRYIYAEEIATIVPIPEAVLADSEYDMWAEIRPRVAEAIARKIDGAIFFGIDKPALWPDPIAQKAVATGHYYQRGTNTAKLGGIAEDLNQLYATVEDDGFDVNGHVTSKSFRRYVRGARDDTGQRLLDVNADGSTLLGEPVAYGMNGLWPTTNTEPIASGSGSGSAPAVGAVELIAGDFSQGLFATRQDITFKILDQAVISDDSGNVILNLAQQDSVALRVVMRCGFAIANPITHSNPDGETRYPFAALVGAAQ